ncbi:MAG: helix-turn-helix domain-containing protein [Chloroflexia bacterium]
MPRTHDPDGPAELPLLLRPAAAAKMLSISRSKIYSMIAAHEIPHVRIGKSGIRIPAQALARWLDEHTQEADEWNEP